MLTREVLQRVREIQIRTRRQVADVLAGEYVSAFRGRGIEFDEVRPYVAGDDVRTIDWKVTARMGEPYVKRYVEERQLTLMLVADVSASQDFGSKARSKREAAAEFCALLAFSAIQSSDKVGLTLFHGAIILALVLPTLLARTLIADETQRGAGGAGPAGGGGGGNRGTGGRMDPERLRYVQLQQSAPPPPAKVAPTPAPVIPPPKAPEPEAVVPTPTPTPSGSTRRSG